MGDEDCEPFFFFSRTIIHTRVLKIENGVSSYCLIQSVSTLIFIRRFLSGISLPADNEHNSVEFLAVLEKQFIGEAEEKSLRETEFLFLASLENIVFVSLGLQMSALLRVKLEIIWLAMLNGEDGFFIFLHVVVDGMSLASNLLSLYSILMKSTSSMRLVSAWVAIL